MATQLEQIARRLRRRVEGVVESERFSPSPNEKPFGLGRLDFREFRRAMRLKAELLKEFRDASLEELYEAQPVENEYGPCLAIVRREPAATPLPAPDPDPEAVREALAQELTLLYGIGPYTAARLRAEGYLSLGDLEKHPRWGPQARELLRTIYQGDLKELQRVLRRWLPVSHPLWTQLCGLVPPERLRIFDIETLGLFGRPIVLLGVARPHPEGWEIRQYVVRDITEELPALWAVLHGELHECAEGEGVLVTYNGKAFDWHMLEERLNYYGLLLDCEPLHIDLLPPARRRFRDELPDARLETVERRLGRERLLDLPSALVPDFYNTYLETGNVGPLVPILEHNKHDLLTLTVLLRELARPCESPSPAREP